MKLAPSYIVKLSYLALACLLIGLVIGLLGFMPQSVANQGNYPSQTSSIPNKVKHTRYNCSADVEPNKVFFQSCLNRHEEERVTLLIPKAYVSRCLGTKRGLMNIEEASQVRIKAHLPDFQAFSDKAPEKIELNSLFLEITADKCREDGRSFRLDKDLELQSLLKQKNNEKETKFNLPKTLDKDLEFYGLKDDESADLQSGLYVMSGDHGVDSITHCDGVKKICVMGGYEFKQGFLLSYTYFYESQLQAAAVQKNLISFLNRLVQE